MCPSCLLGSVGPRRLPRVSCLAKVQTNYIDQRIGFCRCNGGQLAKLLRFGLFLKEVVDRSVCFPVLRRRLLLRWSTRRNTCSMTGVGVGAGGASTCNVTVESRAAGPIVVMSKCILPLQPHHHCRTPPPAAGRPGIDFAFLATQFDPAAPAAASPDVPCTLSCGGSQMRRRLVNSTTTMKKPQAGEKGFRPPLATSPRSPGPAVNEAAERPR